MGKKKFSNKGGSLISKTYISRREDCEGLNSWLFDHGFKPFSLVPISINPPKKKLFDCIKCILSESHTILPLKLRTLVLYNLSSTYTSSCRTFGGLLLLSYHPWDKPTLSQKTFKASCSSSFSPSSIIIIILINIISPLAQH